MNRSRIVTILILAGILFLNSCSSSKKFKASFPVTDSLFDSSELMNGPLRDSALKDLQTLRNNRIDYKTFSAKIKVNYADAYGSQPEGNVVLRLYKDSAIWISVSGSILNLEIYRALVTPDSVTLLNKLEKTVEYLPFSFMEEIAHIPLTFSRLQDLIVGNALFLGDSITGYQSSEKQILIATSGDLFRNILSLSADSKLLQTSSLMERDTTNKRTINLFYGDYDLTGARPFPTTREIIVQDESKIKISLKFRQQEFNNELSLNFNIPANYKTK